MDMVTRRAIAGIVTPAHVYDYELTGAEQEMRQAGLNYLDEHSQYQWEWENFGLSSESHRCALCGLVNEPHFTWIWKYRSQTNPSMAQYVFMCTEREACRLRAAVRSPQ